MPDSSPKSALSHPAVIVGGIVAVGVIIALVARRSADTSPVTNVSYANTPEGDTAAQANAAAIATAAIGAGQANINTAAELIGLEDTNASGITNTRNILAERYAETKATLEEQFAAEGVSSEMQQAIARITSSTQQSITDSNNRLAADQAARAQAVALAQVAAQRQATTDGTIRDVGGKILDIGEKVLSFFALGFL